MPKKKQSSKEWNPVCQSVPISVEAAEGFFRKASIPKPFSIKIVDLITCAERLNNISMTYTSLKHRSKAPKPAGIRKELKNIQTLSKKYHEALANLSFPARTQLPYPFNDPNCFESLKDNVLGLQMKAGEAMQDIGKHGPGAPKKSISTAIIELANLYEETTHYTPGVSVNNSQPDGPFFRFAKYFLEYVDPSCEIGDETLKSDIQKALKLRERYNERIKAK